MGRENNEYTKSSARRLWLVYNWALGMSAFCTGASGLHRNRAAERRELLDSLPDHPGQILITSYDLLRPSDIEQYQNLTFDYQIIDEAQFIKNATTKPPRQLSD